MADPTYERRLEFLGRYCMTKMDPDFPDKVSPGDFVVGGDGTGYGHDHDHACMSLRGAGVAAVFCESTNTNFKRNSIHHGLAVVEVKGIMEATRTGDELEVYLSEGTIRNLSNGKALTFIPYPDFILEMLQAGGLYPHLAEQVKAGVFG
jgi:3-isopropylmalate/(R)-2-methylmalate dehydratase small subunit